MKKKNNFYFSAFTLFCKIIFAQQKANISVFILSAITEIQVITAYQRPLYLVQKGVYLRSVDRNWSTTEKTNLLDPVTTSHANPGNQNQTAVNGLNINHQASRTALAVTHVVLEKNFFL